MSGAVYPTLPGLAFSVSRVPQWNTQVHQAVSLKETRVALAAYPIWTYTLQYDVLRSSPAYKELQQLVDFYNQCRGGYDWFNFSDPDDNTIALSSPQLIGIADGVQTNFQLVRTFYTGGFVEPILSYNSATITDNGVTKTYGADYVINPDGVVSFTVAPTAGHFIRWYGTFYWPCRFVDDSLEAEKFMQDLWQMKKVRFKTVRTTQ